MASPSSTESADARVFQTFLSQGRVRTYFSIVFRSADGSRGDCSRRIVFRFSWLFDRVERKLFLPISSCWWTMITPCSSMNCRNSVICIIMKIIWSVKYVFDHSYAIGWIRSMFMDYSSFCLLWRKKITRHSSIQPFSRSFRIILSMFVYCLSIYGNNVIVSSSPLCHLSRQGYITIHQ